MGSDITFQIGSTLKTLIFFRHQFMNFGMTANESWCLRCAEYCMDMSHQVSRKTVFFSSNSFSRSQTVLLTVVKSKELSVEGRLPCLDRGVSFDILAMLAGPWDGRVYWVEPLLHCGNRFMINRQFSNLLQLHPILIQWALGRTSFIHTMLLSRARLFCLIATVISWIWSAFGEPIFS